MKANDEQKKRTRRACVCAFILTLCVLTTGMALYAVDRATGRTLHGKDYHPAVAFTVPEQWMPARIRVLWAILKGDYAALFSFEREGINLAISRQICL